ncbi:MAG: hypothetical protein AAB091_00600 [Elusimicrobiota bacterium]
MTTIGQRLSILRKLLCSLICLSACLLNRHSLWAGFLPEGAFTNSAAGSTAASFLKLPTSARAASLADSINYSASDPAAGIQAPSLFNGAPERHQFALTSALLPDNIVQASAVYGYPIGAKKIVLAVHEIIQPALTLYDAQVNRVGEFRPSDSAVMIAYASQESACPWGIGLGYEYSRIGPNLSGSGVYANLSGNIPFGYFNDPNLSLAAAIMNLGPASQWAGRSVPLPLRGQIEMSYKMGDLMFLTLDLITPADHAPYGAASIEWKLPFGEPPQPNENPRSGLAVRLGATSKTKPDSFAGRMSFGLGLYLGSLTLDAGVAPFGNFGFFPKVGINFNF